MKTNQFNYNFSILIKSPGPLTELVRANQPNPQPLSASSVCYRSHTPHPYFLACLTPKRPVRPQAVGRTAD